MRFVIGEDSALFREGLARLLEDAGHEVVGRGGATPARSSTRSSGTGPTSRSSTSGCRRTRTDDGARAARDAPQPTIPELAIVLLSQHVETRHSVELVTSGRFGYLLRRPGGRGEPGRTRAEGRVPVARPT